MKLKPDSRAALKIAIIYMVFSVVWILFSDQAVLFLFQNSEDLTRIQTFKGWGFVFVTGVLIFFLLKNEIHRHQQLKDRFEQRWKKYRLVVENTPDLLYRTDMNGVLTFASSSVYALCGYTVEEAIGKKMAEEVYLNPEERKVFLDTLVKNGQVKNFEARLKRKDGSVWWASTNAHLLKDENGTPQGVEGITRDITEKKEAEEKILASEQRLGAILEANPDPMVLYDMEGCPLYLNPAFTRIFGWTLKDLEGRTISYVPEDQKEISQSKIREIYEFGNPLSFETRRYTKDGQVLDIILSAAVSKDREGNPSGMVVNLKDVSREKILATQLEQAQKMESLGTLAGGIAHDFNNLLSGIFGYMELARSQTSDPEVTEFLSRAIESSDRAKGLTHQLLTFSKGGTPITETASLTPFLEESTRFALSGADVSCSFEIPEETWACEYDKNQMGQVIDNMVINAHHAMPSGGNVHVKAENVEVKGREIYALKPGKYVKISISDAGTGIPQKYISRIFDPFFSTKQTGSGLGLATAYSIVNRHGGMIDVQSEAGVGSVFHIFLPSTGKVMAAGAKKRKAIYKGKGAILVMDDERFIREMVGSMLEKMGFSPVLTHDGEAALEAFNQSLENKAPFCAVILDLTVPGGMGGKETVARLRKLDQTIPIFVASGYSEDAAIADPGAFGFTGSIEKPFAMDELADALRAHLSSDCRAIPTD